VNTPYFRISKLARNMLFPRAEHHLVKELIFRGTNPFKAASTNQ
jgi:hypothetical protein